MGLIFGEGWAIAGAESGLKGEGCPMYPHSRILVLGIEAAGWLGGKLERGWIAQQAPDSFVCAGWIFGRGGMTCSLCGAFCFAGLRGGC